MLTIRTEDPLGVAVVGAIHSGDVDGLRRLLDDTPGLATARMVGPGGGDGDCAGGEGSRTLLHVVADWPGHFPRGAETVAVLMAVGADVNVRVASAGDGAHTETPLHWAASSDDVDVLDALLDAGADIEAPGAVIAGGTPLDDAVAFGQWRTARRLVERGARTAPWHAAALGLMDHLDAHFAGAPLPAPHPWGADAVPPPDALTVAFWCACHGGQRGAAEYLLARGAPLDWVAPWDGLTPLDAAEREAAADVAGWLRRQGARRAAELGD